jgi:hypothetical protein
VLTTVALQMPTEYHTVISGRGREPEGGTEKKKQDAAAANGILSEWPKN